MDEKTFDERVGLHYEKVQDYIEVLASARTTFQYMSEAYEEAGQDKSNQSVSDVGRMLLQAQDLFREMRDDPIPHDRSYLQKPSKVTDFKTQSTRNSISLEWKDPDNGESEIKHYEVEWWDGLLRDNTSLCTAGPKATIHELDPESEYSVAVTAVNAIGGSEESDSFKVRTTP
ncbi:MAG: fibronectin type III domain-containing protein [Dehalococcoidia bacterium]|nr:fibronectin type III domain-containing protein [Dehalococcoidia bacterium]